MSLTTTGALERLADRPSGLVVAEARRPRRPPRLPMVVALLAFVALVVGVLVVARRAPEPPVADVPQVPNPYLPAVDDDLVAASSGEYPLLGSTPMRLYAELVDGRPERLLAVLRTPLAKDSRSGAGLAQPTEWFEMAGRPASYSPEDTYGWGLQIVEVRVAQDEKLVVVGFGVSRSELADVAASAAVDPDGLPLLGERLGLPLQAEGEYVPDTDGLEISYYERDDLVAGEPSPASAFAFGFSITPPGSRPYGALLELWVDPGRSVVVDIGGAEGVVRSNERGATVAWRARTGERLAVSSLRGYDDALARARTVRAVTAAEWAEVLSGVERYVAMTERERVQATAPPTTWPGPGG